MPKIKSRYKIFGWLVITLAMAMLSCIYYFARGYYVPFPSLSYQPVPGSTLIEGSFELKIRKPLNPTTLVRYAVPINPENGLPLPSGATMVFYAPFNGEAARIRRGLVPWHRDFAIQHGFTVFSLCIETNTEMTDDLTRYYIYPKSGWGALVFRIQEHLANEFGLEIRPLIIIGESSGGSMAQQMAVSFPDRMSVAAWNGGSRYAPFSAHSDTRMLALNVWGCPGLNRTASMVEDGIRKGFHIRHIVTPPAWNESGRFEQHATWKLSHSLITAFILQSPEFESLMAFLPPSDFTGKTIISFPVPNNASKHVVFLGKPGNVSDLFLKNLMWDAFNCQMVASAVRCADTPEATAERLRLFLVENPFSGLPVVVFVAEPINNLPTSINVQVISEADGWRSALHSLVENPQPNAH